MSVPDTGEIGGAAGSIEGIVETRDSRNAVKHERYHFHHPKQITLKSVLKIMGFSQGKTGDFFQVTCGVT